MTSNSHITEGAHKISFVRSQLIPSPLAAAFNSETLFFDYQKLKTNFFLLSFGVPQTKETFQWAFDAAQTLSVHSGSLDYIRAQSRAAQLATQAVDSLKASSWNQNGVLTEENLLVLWNFSTMLTSAHRNAALLPLWIKNILIPF